tara:strand:- start:3275 stop:3928 length:654 start_codon:yes stop_codon:yes gene_type:complete
MYSLTDPLICGLNKDYSMSGTDFIKNLTNPSIEFNSSWSAVIFSSKHSKYIGGFGGSYTLSNFEAKSLNIYREEEHFGLLYLICMMGDVLLEDKPSVIRYMEYSSFSNSQTHPGIIMRQDSLLYAFYKLVAHASKLFNSDEFYDISKYIYQRSSQVPLRYENKLTKLFFNTYYPKEEKLRLWAKESLNQSRKLKSIFERYFLIKAYLRYFRNVYLRK